MAKDRDSGKEEVESTAGGGFSSRGVENQRNQSNKSSQSTQAQGGSSRDLDDDHAEWRSGGGADRVEAGTDDITRTAGGNLKGHTNTTGNPKTTKGS